MDKKREACWKTTLVLCTVVLGLHCWFQGSIEMTPCCIIHMISGYMSVQGEGALGQAVRVQRIVYRRVDEVESHRTWNGACNIHAVEYPEYPMSDFLTGYIHICAICARSLKFAYGRRRFITYKCFIAEAGVEWIHDNIHAVEPTGVSLDQNLAHVGFVPQVNYSVLSVDGFYSIFARCPGGTGFRNIRWSYHCVNCGGFWREPGILNWILYCASTKQDNHKLKWSPRRCHRCIFLVQNGMQRFYIESPYRCIVRVPAPLLGYVFQF